MVSILPDSYLHSGVSGKSLGFTGCLWISWQCCSYLNWHWEHWSPTKTFHYEGSWPIVLHKLSAGFSSAAIFVSDKVFRSAELMGMPAGLACSKKGAAKKKVKKRAITWVKVGGYEKRLINWSLLAISVAATRGHNLLWGKKCCFCITTRYYYSKDIRRGAVEFCHKINSCLQKWRPAILSNIRRCTSTSQFCVLNDSHRKKLIRRSYHSIS